MITKLICSENIDNLSFLKFNYRFFQFVGYNNNPSESNVNDFESLSTESKRKLLIQLLDLNMLYVNYSDIDDEEYQVSAGDKSFNRSFYGD